LFGSPVFIPEFGPEFELREGKFSSPNPFFRPPSQVVNFLGVDTPLRYQIVYPNESEIAMNPSYGFSMHQEWGNWFARSSYSYKPMNQLLMGVEFYFQHAEAGDQSVSVQVYPRLQYHQLLALEAGFAEIGGWKTWVSWLSEVPENEEVPIEWTYQRTSPSRLVTFYVGRDLASSPLGETQAYLCFSKLEGGDISDGGEFTARYSLFEKRYQFHEVAALGIQGGRSSLFKRNLRWNFRFAFDQAQRGVLWLSDLSYQMANHWQISASLDFLGLVGSEKAQVVDGFLGQYRANDRVQLKVEYVF
ncbi:MAG: hypothetical protein KDD35_07450, partial [Bdellovibrionales bacterium]|nr:hypothetical protein [Bdellovibrionales bacterium]